MNTQILVNDHCGYTIVQPTSGRSVPTGKTRNHEPYHQPQPMRIPDFIPEAPQSPAGFGPDLQPSEDMNNPSLFNSPARSAAEAAGHVAAVCVTARSESVGASVCDARDATSFSSQPHVARQAKSCALYSSKGYAVGIKAQKWMLAEEHVKTDELSDELGSTQQARRRRHDLIRQPALGFRWHGPLPPCVERLPGRPLVLRARQEPGHGPHRGLRGGRGGALRVGNSSRRPVNVKTIKNAMLVPFAPI